jgi:hypothetical protein
MLLIAIGLALLFGIAIAVSPLEFPLIVLAVGGLGLLGLLTPWVPLSALLILAPLRTLIATESPDPIRYTGAVLDRAPHHPEPHTSPPALDVVLHPTVGLHRYHSAVRIRRPVDHELAQRVAEVDPDRYSRRTVS